MIIKKYRPNFFSGFPDEYYEVNSKEELLSSDLCKWSVENGYEIAFSYRKEKASTIMAIKKGKREWWVVAIINNEEDANVLSSWLPNFDEMKDNIELNGIKYKEVPAKTNDKICKDCAYFLDNGVCMLNECPCEEDDTILEHVSLVGDELIKQLKEKK